MKPVIRHLLCVFLTVVLLLGCVPLGETPVEAATTLTEEQFAAKIAALKEQYPHGKYWNRYNGSDSEGNSKAGSTKCPCGNSTCPGSCVCTCGYFKNVGYQCFGFANLLAYKIFGSYATKTMQTTGGVNTSKGWTRYEYSNSSSYNYKAGDFVEVYNYGHSIFITKVTDSYVYYADCNWTGPCQINWNGKKTLSAMRSWTSYVLRMSGNTLTGNGSSNPTLTVKYHANGGTITPVGNYTVTEAVGINLRSSADTSATRLLTIPEGGSFTVTDIATGDGYTWGKTTYGGKTGWCVISEGWAEYEKEFFYLKSDMVYRSSTFALLTDKRQYGTTYSSGFWNASTFSLVREGYHFRGWSFTKNGDYIDDNLAFKPEEIYPALANGSATVTVYAYWEPKLLSTYIATPPAKTVYAVGEELDTTGLELEQLYGNGVTEVVTDGFTVTGFDSSKVGTQTVTVSYAGGSATFSVTVKEAPQAGDMDWDGQVAYEDAVYLLYHVMTPDAYPLGRSGDIDGNGTVDAQDAVYLLYHTVLPTQYPLA